MASGKEFQVLIIRFEKKFPSRTDTIRDLYSLAQCPRVMALRLVKNASASTLQVLNLKSKPIHTFNRRKTVTRRSLLLIILLNDNERITLIQLYTITTRRMYWRRASIQDGQAFTKAPGDAIVLKRFFCDNLVIVMDARSAMRPCYILPMFFLYFFYIGRLSWPNGWTDLHETFTRGRY